MSAFVYTPSRLQQALTEVKREHPSANEFSTEYRSKVLDWFKQQLARCGADADLVRLASRLSTSEVQALLLILPYLPTSLIPRAGRMVGLLWRDKYCSVLLDHFQVHPGNQVLLKLVTELLRDRDLTPLLGHAAASKMHDVLNHPDPIASLAQHSLLSNQATAKYLHQLGLERDGNLKQLLLAHIVLNAQRNRLDTEAEKDVVAAMNQLTQPEKELIPAYVNYLMAYSTGEWLSKAVITTLIIPQLVHKEQLRERLYAKLSESRRTALRRLVSVEMLRHAFVDHAQDEERFQFWRQFADQLIQLVEIKSAEAFALDFGKYGVIEFYNRGNAAYFYQATDFKRKLLQRDPRPADLKQYKEEYGYFFTQSDNRLIHSGDWYDRWTYRVKLTNKHFGL